MKSDSRLPCDCVICQEQREEGRRREAFGGETEALVSPDPIQMTFGFDAGRTWSTGSGARIERFENIEALIDRIDNPSFQDTVDAVLGEVRDLIVARQRTYGPDNIRQQGLFGIVNRIGNDKLARIRQRLNGSIVNGEIVLDEIELGSVDEPGFINDMADIIGYGVCGILLARDEWGMPLAEEID